MKKILLAVSLCVCLISSVVSSQIIRGIDMDFVAIGSQGNAGDTRFEASPRGCGAVDYVYQIGKFEVTNPQWDAFISATGGNSNSYWLGDNVPVNNINWYEAVQFCNYLTSGDKSLGAYLFSGNDTNPGDFLGINRDLSISTYGTTYVLPTEDEWYKAAYYTGNGYSTYANGTDVAPIAGVDTNYDMAISQPWDVGTGTMEQNGTFDMMGNISEWNETWFNSAPICSGGGINSSMIPLGTSYRVNRSPYERYKNRGFRVASVPEPATLALLGLGGLMLRKRRA